MEISKFAEHHKDENFYGFSIDANLLCLNSEEAAAATLNEYINNWETRYRTFNDWQELTEQDLKDIERTLALAEKYKSLDRSDKKACLNEVNQSRLNLSKGGNPYKNEEQQRDLKENTGDWKYQGFSEMTNEVGFDFDAYNEHYDLDEKEQLTSSYAIAMNEVIKKLYKSGVFSKLNCTSNFYVNRVEHDY